MPCNYGQGAYERGLFALAEGAAEAQRKRGRVREVEREREQWLTADATKSSRVSQGTISKTIYLYIICLIQLIIGNLSDCLFYFINSLLSAFNCLSFCIFFCFPLSFLFGLRLSSGTSQLPLPLCVYVRAVCVCVCVFLMHVTWQNCIISKRAAGRTSPIVTFPVNLAPAQPGTGTDRGMDLAVPHIFDTWPGKSQEMCHKQLQLPFPFPFYCCAAKCNYLSLGRGAGRQGAARKVTWQSRNLLFLSFCAHKRAAAAA